MIETRPSLFQRLDTQSSELVSNLSQVSRRVNALVDEETRMALQRTVRDLDTVVHALAGRSDTMASDAARTLENSARATEALTEAMRNVARTAESVQQAAEQASAQSKWSRRRRKAPRAECSSFATMPCQSSTGSWPRRARRQARSAG